MFRSNLHLIYSSPADQPPMPELIAELIQELGKSETAVLLEMFVDGVRQIHDRLPKECEAIDLLSLHIAAHSLKGSAACYGAHRLAKAAALLDRVCYATDCTELRSLIEALRLQSQRAIAEYSSVAAYCRFSAYGAPTAAKTQNRIQSKGGEGRERSGVANHLAMHSIE